MKKKNYNYEVGGIRGGGWFRRKIYITKMNNGTKVRENLKEALQELRVLISQGDGPAIAEALCELVPGYCIANGTYDYTLGA